MQQDNSFFEQNKFSQEMSLQQMQLTELQKISAQLNSTSMMGNTPAASQVNSFASSANTSVAGNVTGQPSNMSTVAASATSPSNVYGNNIQEGARDLFNASVALGGFTLNAGASMAKGGVSVAKAAQNRVTGYIDKMQNSALFAYNDIDWTRTSDRQAELMNLQSQHRFQSAGTRIAGSAVNMAGAATGAAIGSAVMPVLGTFVGGYLGSQASDMAVNGTMKQLGSRQGYEQWMQQNSYRFIDAFESSNGNRKGFGVKDRENASNWLMKNNGKFFMDDDEMFTMLNNVTDAGLMKSTSDMDDFKKKFTSLTDLVKSGARMLNTSYEEMTAMLGDMNKMGIKDDSERMKLLGLTDVTSMITGTTGGQAFNATSMIAQSIAPGSMLDGTMKMEVANAQYSKAAKWKEDWKQFDPDAQNAINAFYNLYGGDEAQLQMGMNQMTGQVLGNDLMKYSLLSVAKQDDAGNLSIDNNQIGHILEGLQKGDISLGGLQNLASRNLSSLGLDANAKIQTTSASDLQAMLLQAFDGNDSQAMMTINKLVESIGKASGGMSTEAVYSNMFGLSNSQAEIMNHYGGKWNEVAGGAIEDEAKALTNSSIISNSAHSQFGLSWFDRVKYGAENISEGIAGLIPSAGRFMGEFREFWGDTDSAMASGYVHAKGVDVSKKEYEKAFDNISKKSDKLKDEFNLDLEKEIGRNDEKTSIFRKGVDLVGGALDIVTSPSKLFSALNVTKWGNYGSVNYKGGTSIEDIVSNVEKSKKLTESERKAMVGELDQVTAQTQNMVSSSLDVVSALGGRSSRKSMLNRTTVDDVITMKTGAKKFDDFADQDVLSKMSLADQKQVQELAIEQATKELSSKFNTDKKRSKLFDKVESLGLADGNEAITKIMGDSKISKSEMSTLVKEMMTEAQAGNKSLSYTELLTETTKETKNGTDNMNNSLKDVNKNYGKVNKELEKLVGQQNETLKMLMDGQSEMQTALASKGYSGYKGRG